MSQGIVGAAVPAEDLSSVPLWLVLAHVWLPTLLVPSVGALVARSGHHTASPSAALAFATGVFAVYTLDRLGGTDGPGSVAARLQAWRLPLGMLAVGSGLVCVTVITRQWSELGVSGILMVLLSLAYQQLRRVPLGKTVSVAVAWMLALHQVGTVSHWGAIDASMALIFAATTIACDLKDEASDRSRRVASLVVIVGASRARLISAGLLIAAAGIATADHDAAIAVFSLLQGVPLTLPLLTRPVLGPLLVDSELAIGALVLARV